MGWFSRLRHWPGSRPPPDAALRAAIARTVAAIPLLRSVSAHERLLAPAVANALTYCDGLAAGIPGPIDVSVGAFGTDPLVHAMFAAPDGIADMLAGSRALRDYLDQPGTRHGDDLYALLGMRQREKAVLGMSLHGGVVQSDVPQRCLYFSDHTLGELASDPDAMRRRTQALALDSLTLGFAARVGELRAARDDARIALSAAHRGSDQQRQTLEQRLHAANAELAPACLLQGLCDWLTTPAERLYLKPTVVNVDRMGVIAGQSAVDGDRGTLCTLNFPELVGRDRRHWIVLQARISWQDVREALQRQRQAKRYLLV